MKKKNRVKKNEEFQAVFQNGKSNAHRQFFIYQLEKPDPAYFRIGLSVSKKLGNAVMRNRTKRMIRQTFTEIKDEIDSGKDFVIIARKPCSDMDYEQLKKSLIHALQRSGVKRAKNGEKRGK